MKRRLLVLMVIMVASVSLFGAPSSTSGKITRLTSIKEGLLIMTSGDLPDNVKSANSSWLLVKKEDTAMIAAVLLAYTYDREITVYTSGVGTVGYGEISQLDLGGPLNG